MESFFMGSIDEFSLKLGILQEKSESVEDQIKILDNKLDKVLDKLTLINGRVGKAHDRMDIADPLIREAHANGNDWVDTKNKAKWLIGGVTLAGGVSGFSLSKLLGGMFS